MPTTKVPASPRARRTGSTHREAATPEAPTPWQWAGWLLVTVLVVLAVRTYVAEPVRITSSSMVGTLRPGDHVLVDKTSRHFREWRRGDVVLFRAPDGGPLTMKRLVGLPGDTVAIVDGRLEVNGAPVREPYVRPGAIDSVYFGPVRVPAAHVFVLGDNRSNSLDSRRYGAVGVERLTGRATRVLWPLRHGGGLS